MLSALALRGVGGLLAIVVPTAVAAIGAGWFMNDRGYDRGYGKAAREAAVHEHVMITREIALWTELGASRETQYRLIDNTLAGWEVSGEARTALERDLVAQRSRADDLATAHGRAIQELQYVKNDWLGVRIPHGVIKPFCVPGGAATCDPNTPAGAPGEGDMAVRGRAPGDRRNDRDAAGAADTAANPTVRGDP